MENKLENKQWHSELAAAAAATATTTITTKTHQQHIKNTHTNRQSMKKLSKPPVSRYTETTNQHIR